MKNNYLGKYFKKEEKKSRKLHREVDPSSWPEYVTATQSRVRRVMSQERVSPKVNKVASSIENLYLDQTAQDIAHSQVSKSRRGKLPRKITPATVLVWGGWGAAMAVFASSLLLNFPFGVGAFILKTVPGEARVGEVVLSQQNTNLHPGDTTEVQVSLSKIEGKSVSQVTAKISYDAGALELQQVETESSSFSKILDSHYDATAGKVYLSAEDEKNTQDTTPKLATISFKVKAFIGKTDVRVIPDTFVTFKDQKANVPKSLGALSLHISQKDIASVAIPLPQKKDTVAIDGSLDDWRDVINYSPASFVSSGTVLSDKNLKEGKIASQNDFSGVLQLAQNNTAWFLAFSASDDEVLEGDKVAIKFGAQVFEIPILAAINQTYLQNGVEARATKESNGYVLEVKIPTATLKDSNLNQPFNFEVHDIDSQDSADVILSYPNDSRTQP